jgi:hypothetical protein
VSKRLITTLSALVLAAAACGGANVEVTTLPTTPGTTGGATGTTTSSGGADIVLTPTSAQPTTAWDQVLSDLGDSIPLQTAIDAFSLAFGPIDGASASTLPSGFTGDGSGPLRWLLGHWDDLTPTQQGQVTDRIAAWEASDTLGFGAGVDVAYPRDAAYAESYQALVDDSIVSLEALLGRSLDVPVTVKMAKTTAGLDDAWAVTIPHDAGGGFTGPIASCDIVVSPTAAPFTGAKALAIAAHEAFHCFEASLGTLAQSTSRPSWIVEGMAAWAGEVVAHGSDGSKNWWDGWLHVFYDQPLFARAYSTIGFYSHLTETGIDVWSRMDEAILASDGSSDDAYQVLIESADPDVIDTWAAGLFRDPTDAPRWDEDGPGITFDMPDVPYAELGNDTSALLDAQPHTALVAEVDATAEVVTFDSPGRGLVRFADGTSRPLDEVHGTAFCTTGACSCPEGTPGYGTAFQPMEAGVTDLAPTGHMGGSRVLVIGWSLQRYCNQERCQVGTWTSVRWDVPRIILGGNGAPLVITRDGEGYVNWGEAAPLLSWVHGGTFANPNVLLPLKIELHGASHFLGEYEGRDFKVTSSAGTFGLTPYIDFGNGWESTTGADAGVGGFAGIGTAASFACAGDTLVLNGAIEFSRVSTEATLPGEAQDITPTTSSGGEGTGGQPGATPEVNPCSLLKLAEVKTLDPDAKKPDGPDDLGTTMLIQCTFLPALSIQVSGPMGPGTYTSGAEAFGLTVVDLPGIGDWAVAEISPADPTIETTDSVLVVAAGNATGTVAIVPFSDVTPGTPEYDALIQLLQTALDRL